MVFGTVAVASSVVWAWSAHDLVSRGERAQALVVTLPHGGYHSELQFRTAAGDTINEHLNSYVELKVGDTVPLVFDPADPAGTMQVDDFATLWLPSLALFVGGLAALFMGLARRRPSQFIAILLFGTVLTRPVPDARLEADRVG